MNLIVVESPTKARTLAAIAGADFEVVSVGRRPWDRYGYYPDSLLATSPPPKYLRQCLARNTGPVYLALDPDHDGEARSWHLARVLGLKNPRRLILPELSGYALERALTRPRYIRTAVVKSRDARRLLASLESAQVRALTGLSLSLPQIWLLNRVWDGEKNIPQKGLVGNLQELSLVNGNSTWKASCPSGMNFKPGLEFTVTRVTSRKVREGHPLTLARLMNLADQFFGGSHSLCYLARGLYENGHISFPGGGAEVLPGLGGIRSVKTGTDGLEWDQVFLYEMIQQLERSPVWKVKLDLSVGGTYLSTEEGLKGPLELPMVGDKLGLLFSRNLEVSLPRPKDSELMAEMETYGLEVAQRNLDTLLSQGCLKSFQAGRLGLTSKGRMVMDNLETYMSSRLISVANLRLREISLKTLALGKSRVSELLEVMVLMLNSGFSNCSPFGMADITLYKRIAA